MGKRGEALKIGSSNDAQETTCLLLRIGKGELINDTIGVSWVTKSRGYTSQDLELLFIEAEETEQLDRLLRRESVSTGYITDIADLVIRECLALDLTIDLTEPLIILSVTAVVPIVIIVSVSTIAAIATVASIITIAVGVVPPLVRIASTIGVIVVSIVRIHTYDAPRGKADDSDPLFEEA